MKVFLHECIRKVKDSENPRGFQDSEEMPAFGPEAVSAEAIYFWKKEMGKLNKTQLYSFH